MSMHAASRESMNALNTAVDERLASGNTVVDGATIGGELFDVVAVLDEHRALRAALVDDATSVDQREGLLGSVFGNKVALNTLEVLKAAVAQTWSNTRDFRRGLVLLGRRALLRSAEAQGQLETVESELFQLARLMEAQPELEMHLADERATADRRRSLLAACLYGKVTAVTETLALQAVARPTERPVEDFDELTRAAAEIRGQRVAHVVSASALSDGQRDALAEKLSRIYDHPMSIHTEIDSSLLGGMIIRVGNERIDGSTAGKIARLRRQFA